MLSALTISPPIFSAIATASAVLPVAVGPTIAIRSSGRAATMRRTCSAADSSLELVIADPGDHRPSVGAVAGEVDVVERAKQRGRLRRRQDVAGADAAV